MYPDFTTLLNLNHHDLAKGHLIFIEDSKTDGSFLLHHFISSFLKGGGNVCLVGLSQSFVHYSAIGKKLGLNLNAAKESGQLVFMNGMELVLKSIEKDDTLEGSEEPFDLKSFYNDILSHLTGMSHKPTLLLIDELNTLISAGISVERIADFMHYCRCLSLNTEMPVCLLTLLHCDDDVEDDDVIYIRNQLKYHMTMHFTVRGLETGYSRDVHGQIEVKQRTHGDVGVVTPQSKTMQYKLNDKGVRLFPLGTSAAVL